MNILHLFICTAIISVIGLFVKNYINATAGLILIFSAIGVNMLVFFAGTIYVILLIRDMKKCDRVENENNKS